MPLSWPDHLEVARALARRPGEAWQRAAISRAYYAAFYAAVEKISAYKAATQAGVSLTPLPRHEWLWQEYRVVPIGGWYRISQEEFSLREDRTFADYYPDIPHPDGIGLDMVERVADFIQRLAALPLTPIP